ELLQSDFDRLILNGDVLDSLNMHRLQSEHWAVLDQIRKLARKREVVLLRGNHEGSPADWLGEFGPVHVLSQLLEGEMCDEYRLQVGDRPYAVLHGDIFDRTMNLSRIGDAADYAYNVIQGISRPFARWLKSRVKHWGGVIRSVRDGATAYAREKQVEGIITGH